MKVYGQINYTGTMKYNGSDLNLEYITDDYKNGLSLTKGYIGGGYISSSVWSVVTTIQNSTDTWGTSANASLRSGLYYGGWASSHTNGYMFWCGGSNINQKMPFSTEVCANIDNRNYASGNSSSQVQHGIGYNTDGSFYGTRAYTLANADSTNYDKLNFAADTWAAASDGAIATQTAYTQAWFDKFYGFSLGSNGLTKRYPFSTETWGNITASPDYMQTAGAWGKGLPTKDAKSYVIPNNAVAPFMKFMHTTYSYVANSYNQTLNNGENCPIMGQNHGYWAGGYNGVQNAHTDRVEYNTDTVINIPDAPRALSSGSPMWSGY